MAIKQILPAAPFDGQEFIDAFRIKWVYNSEDATWTKIGVVLDVPVARPEDHELGPTNGLLSAQDKILLDGLKPKAGGFGLILKPGYYLTTENGPENVLTGDVKLISETLKFTCALSDANDACGPQTIVKVGLSDAFLQSYALEIQGPKGPDGNQGGKGRDGRPGTGDGPQGDPGVDGQDKTTVDTFTEITYQELDSVYDTAVVSLKLDSTDGILEVTKAKMDVPDSDKPARRVTAVPAVRGVEFLSTDMSSWQLLAPSDDQAGITDLNVVKLPKGWSGGSEDPVPVTMVRLSTVVQTIVDYYDIQAQKIIAEWDKQLREWAVETDEAARGVLHALAKQLAESQFELPLEFCLGIEPQDCNSGNTYGHSITMVFVDESTPYQDTTTYNSDLALYRNGRNRNPETFASINSMVLVPGGGSVIPPGEPPPPEFAIVSIGRPPTVGELTTHYQTLASGAQVDSIFLIVDNSGSMTTRTLGDAYIDFVSWLRTNTSANVVEVEFISERWILEINSYYETLITPPSSPP